MPTGADGIYQVPGTSAIWLLYNNEWHWCPSEQSFLAWGYSWADVQTITLAIWCQHEVGQHLTDDGNAFDGPVGYIPPKDRSKLVCPVEPPPEPEYTCEHCPAIFSSQVDLDAHIASEHPTPPPPTLKCPLCDQDLGVTGTTVEVIQEGPIFQQLRDEITQLDATIANLQALIVAVQAEIDRIKEILGL